MKTGKIAWQDRSFSRAQLLYADGKLIVLDEDGTLGLATVSPQGLKVLARAPVLAEPLVDAADAAGHDALRARPEDHRRVQPRGMKERRHENTKVPKKSTRPLRVRTFVVDDEQLARNRLKQLLSTLEDVDIVGEAAEGDEAVRGIQDLRPDLVFLDIQMPGRSGLEIAASLAPPRPNIVFCTAFDQYAIRAFELHAVDYLLKPVSRDRLAQTVERIRQKLSENREMVRDLQSAQVVQERLFPHVLPAMATLDYAGACRPARSVGGDYFDFLPLGSGRLGIALADVSGKGVAAALLMASLQGRLQSQARAHGDDPAGLLRELNRDIWRTTEGARYITMFYGVYDDGARTLSYVNAGHNPPLVRGAVNRQLDRGGTVLGCFESIVLEPEAVTLAPGDTLVVFSDGITEARNARDEEFGEARLASLIESAGNGTAQQLRDLLLEQVEAFGGGIPAQDDRTAIVARVR